MTHPCMYAIDSIVCHGHHQQKTQFFVSINLSIIHTDPSYGYIIYVIFVIVSILIIPIGLLTIYFKGYYMYYGMIIIPIDYIPIGLLTIYLYHFFVCPFGCETSSLARCSATSNAAAPQRFGWRWRSVWSCPALFPRWSDGMLRRIRDTTVITLVSKWLMMILLNRNESNTYVYIYINLAKTSKPYSNTTQHNTTYHIRSDELPPAPQGCQLPPTPGAEPGPSNSAVSKDSGVGAMEPQMGPGETIGLFRDLGIFWNSRDFEIQWNSDVFFFLFWNMSETLKPIHVCWINSFWDVTGDGHVKPSLRRLAGLHDPGASKLDGKYHDLWPAGMTSTSWDACKPTSIIIPVPMKDPCMYAMIMVRFAINIPQFC